MSRNGLIVHLVAPCLLLGSMLLPFAAVSQKHYRPGHVVLVSGDTLTGLVMDRKETFVGTDLLQKIRFKPEEGGRRRKYRPRKLASYQVEGVTYESFCVRPQGISLLDAYYEVVPNDGEWIFLRVVNRGRLTHYQWEWIDEDDAGVESADYFRKADELLLVRATQGIFGLKRKNLVKYFRDCPNLQQKLEQELFKYPAEVTGYYNQNCP